MLPAETVTDMATTQSEIVSLQILRGVAAMLVVMVHSATPLGAPLAFGNIGVDIFFVISGFVMWLTTFGRHTTTGTFFLKRILRIVPLYWAITLALAFLGTDPLGLRLSESIPDLLRSLFFIPYYDMEAENKIYPILFVGWTLNVEMFFYAIFAVFLPFGPVLRFLGVSAVLICLIIAGLSLQIEIAAFELLTDSIIGIFIFGMGLGVLYTATPVFQRKGWLSALLLGLAGAAAYCAVNESGLRVFDAGVVSLLIVVAVLAMEPLCRHAPVAPLRVLGDASYSIYLVHPIVLKLINQALGPDPFGLPPWPTFFALMTASALGGVMVYYIFEKPVGRVLSRLVRRRPLAQTGVSQA